jgi:hypothetical protein
MRRARSRPWTAGPDSPHASGHPEKASHDYVRHERPPLFAALEVATGKVTNASCDRHRHEEFGDFSKKSLAPTRVASCTSWSTTAGPTLTPTSVVARGAPGSRFTVAESRGGVLREHHPASHPPMQFRKRNGSRGCDPAVHRRLERALPSVRLNEVPRRRPRGQLGHEPSDFDRGEELPECLSLLWSLLFRKARAESPR